MKASAADKKHRKLMIAHHFWSDKDYESLLTIDETRENGVRFVTLCGHTYGFVTQEIIYTLNN